MIITTAMGHGAGLGGPGRGSSPPRSHRGRPGAASSTAGPPPRRSRPTGTQSPPPVRDGGRVCPRRPGKRSRGTGCASRTAVPLPVTTVPGSVARDGVPGTSVPTARSPVYPSSDKFVRGYRQVDQVHPPGRHRGAGRPGRSSSTYRRTGTPAETSAAPPPRGARMSRTPGGPVAEYGGQYPPGMYRQHRRGERPPGTPRPPRAARHVRRAVQHRRRPPRGTGARRCCWWGSQGGPRRGNSPRRAARYRRGRGSDRLDVLAVASPVSGDPRYAIPTGERPVRDGRTPRAPPPGVYRQHRPPRSATAPPGTRPRRDAVLSGNEFLMFRNPFPRVGGGVRRPVRPREQGVRGPYRYDFAG